MTRLPISLLEPVPKAKSKAALVAELLPDIEAALEAGHNHQIIFEQVKNIVGLDLTLGYYKNTLHRIRQRNGASAKSAAPAPAAPDRRQPPRAVPPIVAAQSNDAPRSKLQAVLSESIDDFFS